MKEIALYRKYRPNSFREILGQEHIVKVLEDSLNNNSFVHAYLFSGSRGTGKTSIARILAGGIGCSVNDIHEIDAASNRKIDDVREIREAVHSLPFDSPYKTYIIDEVHMLTKEAFNALLKTLEEPPAHVVFVLATTEPEKLPDTISSRCQSFSFKKPTHSVLKKAVSDIAEKEGVLIKPETADLIALLGEGSFRDAQSVLQKVISSTTKNEVSHEQAVSILGAPKGDTINSLIEAIQEENLEKALFSLEESWEENVDMNIFLNLLLKKIRAVILLRHAPKMEKNLKESFSEKDFEFVKKISIEKEPKINSLVLKKFLEAKEHIAKSYIQSLPLEIALIELFEKK